MKMFTSSLASVFARAEEIKNGRLKPIMYNKLVFSLGQKIYQEATCLRFDQRCKLYINRGWRYYFQLSAPREIRFQYSMQTYCYIAKHARNLCVLNHR